MNTLKINAKNNLNAFLKNNRLSSDQVKTLCLFALFFLALTPEVLGVKSEELTDKGFKQSTSDLLAILNNSLIPITLVAGCLASAALAFMKSTPTPFVIAILTTISFGFAKVWINTTYAICV
jgi:hypothetical protein